MRGSDEKATSYWAVTAETEVAEQTLGTAACFADARVGSAELILARLIHMKGSEKKSCQAITAGLKWQSRR